MSGQTELVEEDPSCGHPTQAGGLCSRSPMTGSDRCHQHAGLEPTEAEAEASKSNPVEHGYFFTGFREEWEKFVYHAITDGRLSPAEIQRQVMAALVVRSIRLLRWESEGKDVSKLTTRSLAELRKTLNALDPEALKIKHTYEYDEILESVKEIVRDDPAFVARLVPSEKHDIVREALD